MREAKQVEWAATPRIRRFYPKLAKASADLSTNPLAQPPKVPKILAYVVADSRTKVVATPTVPVGGRRLAGGRGCAEDRVSARRRRRAEFDWARLCGSRAWGSERGDHGQRGREAPPLGTATHRMTSSWVGARPMPSGGSIGRNLPDLALPVKGVRAFPAAVRCGSECGCGRMAGTPRSGRFYPTGACCSRGRRPLFRLCLYSLTLFWFEYHWLLKR